MQVDLGSLGLAEGGYLLIKRAVRRAGVREEITVSGTLEGEIALEPRGNEGFGYDPVFVPLGQPATVAELGDG